jgi:hypothetical protein
MTFSVLRGSNDFHPQDSDEYQVNHFRTTKKPEL